LAPFFLFIVRQPKVVFVEYSPKQKLTKSLTTFLKTLRPGLKSLGRGILNVGVGPEILDPEWVGTRPKIFFGIWHFYIK
jgi:hypothetical protein